MGMGASVINTMGYQTNTIVYGPGYRFADFRRVGTPLDGLVALVTFP